MEAFKEKNLEEEKTHHTCRHQSTPLLRAQPAPYGGPLYQPHHLIRSGCFHSCGTAYYAEDHPVLDPHSPTLRTYHHKAYCRDKLSLVPPAEERGVGVRGPPYHSQHSHLRSWLQKGGLFGRALVAREVRGGEKEGRNFLV